MAVKTFTTGEVLTAADTNTYLANAGLVYIKSHTITNATTNQIDDIFSATYSAYVMVWTGLIMSGATHVQIQFRNSGGTSSTGYYSGGLEVTTGATVVGVGQSNASGGQCAIIGVSSDESGGIVEIYNPYESTMKTSWTGRGIDARTGGNPLRLQNGWHNVDASYTGLIISGGANSFTSGLITFYGYRKA